MNSFWSFELSGKFLFSPDDYSKILLNILWILCSLKMIIETSVFVFQASFAISLEDDDVSPGDIRAEILGPDSVHNVHFNWVGRTGHGYFTPNETGLHRVCRLKHLWSLGSESTYTTFIWIILVGTTKHTWVFALFLLISVIYSFIVSPQKATYRDYFHWWLQCPRCSRHPDFLVRSITLSL